MRKSFAISAATALILLFLLASFAASLENPFCVYGDVSNSTGAPVPVGVNVTVRDVTAGGEVIAQTDAAGHYQIDVSPIPNSADGNSFTCSASYADETGSCSFTLDLTKPSQPCDIGLSTQIAIEAEAGGSLPDSIPVDETFTVLITEDGSPVGADTTVTFRLPVDGDGDPVYVSTDDDGKARYMPLIIGTLGIKVLVDTVTVAEATVEVTEESGITQLDRVEISPDSADLLIGGTEPFSAICYATSGGTITGCTLTWACDSSAVGTIDSSGLFTANGVGTATVTVSATYSSRTRTDTAVVNVSAPAKTVDLIDEDNFTEEVDAGTAANITVNGTFDHNVTGSIEMTPVAEPEETVGSYAFTGDDVALIGITVEPDAAIADELEDGNDTIRIEICYNAAELADKNIDPSALALWRFNVSTGDWDKMVAGTDPCVANGITGNCVWIKVNNLSTFALVGTKTVTLPSRGGGGGRGGTYPPGWGTTTTTAAVTATAAPGATPGATPGVTPPEEAVTTPTEPAVAEETAPEESEETPTKKPGIPGFTAVFAIAGLLAIAYAMMRRRD